MLDWIRHIYKANCLLFKVIGWVCDSISVAIGVVVGLLTNILQIVPEVPIPDGSDWAKDLVLIGVFIWLAARGVAALIKQIKK